MASIKIQLLFSINVLNVSPQTSKSFNLKIFTNIFKISKDHYKSCVASTENGS